MLILQLIHCSCCTEEPEPFACLTKFRFLFYGYHHITLCDSGNKKSTHPSSDARFWGMKKKKIDYDELFQFFSHECDPQNKKLISLFVSFSIGELKRKQNFPCAYENVLRAYEIKSWRFWTWTKFFAHEGMFGATLLIVQKTRHLQRSVMVALCCFSSSWTVRERNDVAVELKSQQAVEWTVEELNFCFFVGAGAKLVT